MGIHRGPNIVTDGLILSMDPGSMFHYPGTGTIWQDRITHTNGTLVGGLTYSTEVNGCFDTNVTNSTTGNYLTTPSTIAFADTDAYSFDIWVKLSTSGTTAPDNSLFGNLLTSPWLHIQSSNSNGLSWSVSYRASGNIYNNFTTITDTDIREWTNIVVTVATNRSTKLYINGEFRSSVTPTTTVFNVSVFGSGGYQNSTTYWALRGSFSTTKIYSKTLTEEEVSQNFNAHKTRFGL